LPEPELKLLLPLLELRLPPELEVRLLPELKLRLPPELKLWLDPDEWAGRITAACAAAITFRERRCWPTGHQERRAQQQTQSPIACVCYH